jgi:hypothetical protein
MTVASLNLQLGFICVCICVYMYLQLDFICVVWGEVAVFTP